MSLKVKLRIVLFLFVSGGVVLFLRAVIAAYLSDGYDSASMEGRVALAGLLLIVSALALDRFWLICPNCGGKIIGGDNYCGTCGDLIQWGREPMDDFSPWQYLRKPNPQTRPSLENAVYWQAGTPRCPCCLSALRTAKPRRRRRFWEDRDDREDETENVGENSLDNYCTSCGWKVRSRNPYWH